MSLYTSQEETWCNRDVFQQGDVENTWVENIRNEDVLS